jgi:hypothetical protein
MKKLLTTITFATLIGAISGCYQHQVQPTSNLTQADLQTIRDLVAANSASSTTEQLLQEQVRLLQAQATEQANERWRQRNRDLDATLRDISLVLDEDLAKDASAQPSPEQQLMGNVPPTPAPVQPQTCSSGSCRQKAVVPNAVVAPPKVTNGQCPKGACCAHAYAPKFCTYEYKRTNANGERIFVVTNRENGNHAERPDVVSGLSERAIKFAGKIPAIPVPAEFEIPKDKRKYFSQASVKNTCSVVLIRTLADGDTEWLITSHRTGNPRIGYNHAKK